MEGQSTTSVNLYDSKTVLPNLAELNPEPVDLMADYWTPVKEGEQKRMFFSHFASRAIIDEKTGDEFDLVCAFFVEQTQEGLKMVSNGSKRLVGALEMQDIKSGTPLQVTYLGKRKNSTNQYQSDYWSIKKLRING